MRSRCVVGGLTLAVAFLLATNPVVVDAAGQITGAQIKNSSIKGKDVKDASLTGKDLKDGSVTGTDVDEKSLVAVDAATLNGQPPSAYQTPSYKYRLQGSASSSAKTWSFTGMPPGTYTYSWSLVGAATGYLGCELRANPAVDVVDTWAVGVIYDSFIVVAGAGSTGLTSVAPQLRCASGAPYTVYPGADFPSSVTFTKVSGTTPGAGTLTRIAATVGRAGPLSRR